MAFSALLDTCVLYPAHLRDTLLRLAERELYVPRWSFHIRQELIRNIIERGVSEVAVTRLLDSMLEAFPEADVMGYESLIESMTCQEKDRHVLAAAVRAKTPALVTFNIRDFPAASVEKFGVEVVHPDDFLLDLLDLAPRIVIDDLHAQAARNRREPQTWSALLDVLERAGVPKFVSEVRRRQ